MKSASLYKSAEGERLVSELYDRTLAKWPVPHEDIRIATRHGEIFVIASGPESAKPLIVLHGSCSNALSWMADICKYTVHFRSYAIDIISEPGRSSPTKPEVKGTAFSEWMEDILDSLKINKTLMVGMSYGGWTALKFASYQPDRIEKLALIAPGGIIPMRPWFALRDRLLLSMGKWGARKTNRILFGKQHVPSDVLNNMDLVMANVRSRNAGMPVFSNEELRRLTMPVLVLGGLKDPVQNMSRVTARLKKLFPDLTINIDPKAGHIRPDSVSIIIPFLLS
jgi:pimeloyl-ACP methyl ester carboxylesterase